MKIYNTIFTRDFETCDYRLLRFLHKKNKSGLETNFYYNDILMSGTIKVKDNNALEILYLKYFSENEIDENEALKIYHSTKFIFPTYEEYLRENQRDIELDVVNKIIRRIAPIQTTQIFNRQQYYDECSKIQTMLHKPFSSSFETRKRIKVNMSYMLSDIIKEKELSFIGIAAPMEPKDFEEMICCKILEKLFGSNDVFGIYYEFRKRGWIYTGLSGYVIDENFFYSGVIMQYNIEHEKEILQCLEEVKYSPEDFDNARKMFLDDYKYSVFQYGEEFAMLPYKMQYESAKDFEAQLNHINIDNVENMLHDVYINKQIVRMKVI